jgi:ABC-type Co2+ transport system permease subunit
MAAPAARRQWRTAMLRNILLVTPIAAVFVFAVYYMLFAWSSPGDVDMHASGYIAMTIGVVASFALAAVLIVLLLHRNKDEE